MGIIPKIFFQTSRFPMAQDLVKMTMSQLSEGWIYRHFLDSDIVHFLESHPLKEFPNAVQKFNQISGGEHKADFFRYYFLYVKGGVFMDSDAMIYQPIEEITKDYSFFSVNSSTVPDSIFQGVIGAEPRNPLIYRALSSLYLMDPVTLELNYHILCKNLFQFFTEIENKENYKLYSESPFRLPDEYYQNVMSNPEDTEFKGLFTNEMSVQEKESIIFKKKFTGDKILNDKEEIIFIHYWANKEGIPCTLKAKNLVYCCVFYNKDYFKLLDLLLKSMRMYSSLDSFDFLVITQKELEPSVKSLGNTLGLDLKVFCLEFTTIFQAACARLFIFDYPEIQGYEKLLYIDTDILIKGDLKPVLELPIKNLLYGIESGTIESLNFGAQFFNFTQVDKSLTGLNSGTLLFLNSLEMKSLFQRIRVHLDSFTQSGQKPPYCMDQPFINFHAIKDSLYDNQLLNSHVSLFEGNDTVSNYTTSSICHFSFPIGNFGHKFFRMKEFLDKTLNRDTVSNASLDLMDKKYSWNTGYIRFSVDTKGFNILETTWGNGSFIVLDNQTICAHWNTFYHIMKFNESFTEYISIRTNPKDFEFTKGSLIESHLNIYGDSHAMMAFRNLKISHRNLFQYSRTMYRIGRDNTIINFNEEHLSRDRVFCFGYGEVDVRGHIGKQVHYGRHHENVCKELVDAYFSTIQSNIKEYKAIIILAISPPTSSVDHEPCKIHTEITGGPIPFIGTDWARMIYRTRMNELLEEGCKKYGYHFFNPYDFYTREDGTLKYEMSDNCIHIGKNQHILDEFYKLYGSL